MFYVAPQKTSSPTPADKFLTITGGGNKTIITGVNNHYLPIEIEGAWPPLKKWPCRPGTQKKVMFFQEIRRMELDGESTVWLKVSFFRKYKKQN